MQECSYYILPFSYKNMPPYYATIHLEGSYGEHPHENIYKDRFQVQLIDRSWLDLPLCPLPHGQEAIALLMSNQSAFTVTEYLMRLLAQQIKPLCPDTIVAVPTMGLEYGSCLAKQLHMNDYVAMGFSRKFWYDESIKETLCSTTSPNQQKNLYLDPALLDRVQNKRVIVVDDVINTGQSIGAAIKLLQRVGAKVIAVAVGLTEGYEWHSTIRHVGLDPEHDVISNGHIPVFIKKGNGWMSKPGT